MPVVDVSEAEAMLSRLVQAVESGAEEEIVIARDGKPAARLVPLAPQPPRQRRLGLAEGLRPAFDYEKFKALDPEVEEMFEAEKSIFPG